MRLLLDEMISPRITRELRKRGFDVEKDRPDLEALADLGIVRRLSAEARTIVTNDVIDFHLIHNRLLAAGEVHCGIVFTNDATLPRNKASIGLWVNRLMSLLEEYDGVDGLRNRVIHI